MLGTHDLWLFVLGGLLLNVTPGPDTLYIVARSTTQGFRIGAVAALGIGAGTLVHISAAALGLSALLAASAGAFTVVKVLGALYLLYLGISLLLSHHRNAPGREVMPAARVRVVFLQGFLTNVLNPKVALFFLALLPQFIAVDAPSKALALLFLGLIFDCNGTLWNLFVAWSAARARKILRGKVAAWLQQSLGALFILLAARLAVSRNG